MIEVRVVPPRDTFPLRQAVLRPHQQIEDLVQFDDDAPDARSFAAFDETGAIVGTGCVSRRPTPYAPDRTGWQLRGMAVAPGQRGQGIGSAVLDAILDHARAEGGGVVWCNARTPAQGVYARAGFTPRGDVFEQDVIGPHIVMTLEVEPKRNH